ncbi:hypothetical protein AA0117_g8786 [Alternaria alternata]|jgi:hypothetical protein|uniref:Uncharacterized protein n=1 Tax=Alternaria alternata TaxID=5599 RepID=A0A4Q4N9I9_ALTAL|nr:hypothetical protein AA0118_g2574 [Alternaria tenuissima]RYN72245.1 hypothetical protein AA0117_g8786 [Alternaria alternata]
MAALWIVLSTRWGLSSVQASLNVIISVLGTIGLWAFTRFWWRRGCTQVLRKKTGVPLHKLFSIAGLGEGWDTTVVLRRQIFAKQNWHLLLQLVVVIGVTLTCALAGPIAKISLKNGLTVARKQLQVLPATQGAGYFGNALFEEVLWNDTAQSLIKAGFPDNQLLDFLPLATEPPWTYVDNEWDPTWTMKCAYQDDMTLANMTGSGNHDFYHPIDAFPAYRESFASSWLDSSKYRVTSDFDSFQNWSLTKQFREALFFTIIQSDPEIDSRMLFNNETLDISISLLHASDFQVSYVTTGGTDGGTSWRPIGTVGHASYSRVDCRISRKTIVEHEDKIPWPWTNDTASIVKGFTTYYMAPFIAAAVKDQVIDPPSARELVRFYQVYIASTNTQKSNAIPRTLSVKVQTVELSVIFLVILIILTLSTAWNSIRYAIFLRRNKTQLEELYLPDGRIEWMIHAVKTSEVGIDLERNADWKRKDSEHFCTAVIGADIRPGVVPFDASIRVPRLARVQSCRGSSMSDMPSRHYSVSPARSNLGSVSEADDVEEKEVAKSVSDVSSHKLSPSPSMSKRSQDVGVRSEGTIPTLCITTDSSPATEPTMTRTQTAPSTLGVPSQVLPRSPNVPD